MLHANDVVSGYGNIEILHGLSIRLRENKVTCIIGPNGSGKTTLFRTLIGIVKPKRGDIFFEGENIAGLKPHVILEKGISLVPQGRMIFPQMTVLENLEVGAYVIKDGEKVKEMLEMVYNEFPILKNRRRQSAGTLSGGEQTMLVFGRALMLDPKIILFDEPSLGLAPQIINAVYKKIEDVTASGKTVALVEQNVRKALSISDYVYVLDLGRIRFEGTCGELFSEKQLIKLYLGVREY